MEPEIKVMKHGVTIQLTHAQALENNIMRWEFVESIFNSAYKRKVIKRTWVPVSEETLTKYEALMAQLAAVEDELYEVGAEHGNDEGWEPPTGHYEYEYGETYDEWIERCRALDAAR